MDSKKHSCVFWKKWLLRDLDGRKWKTGSLARAFSCQTYFGGAHNGCKMCLFIMSLLWTDYKNAEIPILFMYNKKIITINAQRYPKIKPLTECNALLLFVPFGSLFFGVFFPFRFLRAAQNKEVRTCTFNVQFSHWRWVFKNATLQSTRKSKSARALAHTHTSHKTESWADEGASHEQSNFETKENVFAYTKWPLGDVRWVSGYCLH